MCPELVSKQSYDAKKADVFALGVVFYVLAKASPPFVKADVNSDVYYKTLQTNPEHYWSSMDEENIIPKGLKSIIEQCLQMDP